MGIKAFKFWGSIAILLMAIGMITSIVYGPIILGICFPVGATILCAICCAGVNL